MNFTPFCKQARRTSEVSDTSRVGGMRKDCLKCDQPPGAYKVHCLWQGWN